MINNQVYVKRENGVVVQTDDDSFKQYIMLREKAKAQKTLEQRIDRLEKTVTELNKRIGQLNGT